MKKKYLAYMLSAAMLTSMMPTTSVYAEVTQGSAIKIEKKTSDNGFTDADGQNTVPYSNDDAATNVTFTVTNEEDATAQEVTVKVYKKSGGEAESNQGTGQLSATTAKSTADVAVNIDGLAAGEYTAKATIDSQESDEGVDFTVTPKEVTVTGITATNRAYDGKTAVELVKSSAAAEGIEDKDKAEATLNTEAATGSIADANVGTSKPVTVSGITLDGDKKDNYKVTQPTDVTVDITQATPTLTWKGELTLGGQEGGSITAPQATDVQGVIEGLGDVTFKYYTEYASAESNTLTNTDNSGATSEGGQPTKAGNYFVVASLAESDNCAAASTPAHEFNITAKDEQDAKIESVIVEDFTPTVETTPVPSEITVTTENVTGTVAWKDTTPEDSDSSVTEFKAGHTYQATVTLTSTGGKEFADGEIAITGIAGKDNVNATKGIPATTATFTVDFEIEAEKEEITVPPVENPSGNKAEFTVEGTNVEQGTEVALEAKVTNNGDQVKEATVTLPQNTANAFAGQQAPLKVTTDVGVVELPKEATEKIGAATGDVVISMKDVSDTTKDAAGNIKAAYEVSVKQGSAGLLEDKDGNGTIKVTVPKPAGIDGNVYAYYDADADNNNELNEKLTANISGDTNSVVVEIGHLSKIVLSAEELTVKQDKVDITEVAITKVTAPKTGETPVDTATSGAADQYKVDSVTWTPDLADGKFKEGTVYTAKITLSPLDGYKFPATALTKEKVTVDGQQATTVENGENSNGKLVVTYEFPETKEALKGVVTVDGTAVFDQTLTAKTDGITNDDKGTLSYKWLRDGQAIPSANAETYKLVREDIGKKIAVEVTSDTVEGTLTSEAIGPVEKADCTTTATAPTKHGTTEPTHNVITLTEIGGHEFSKDDGKTWQTSNVFTGLEAKTEYTFVSRVAETETHKASAKSTGFTLSTADDASLAEMAGTAKVTGDAVFGKELTAAYEGSDTASAGTLYYKWFRGDVEIPNATSDKYTLVQEDVNQVIKVQITCEKLKGMKEASTDVVAKAEQTASPTAPVMETSAADKIQVTVVEGHEYSIENQNNWNKDGIFTGLTPDTEYKIVSRIAETETHKASVVSAPVAMRTGTGTGTVTPPSNGGGSSSHGHGSSGGGGGTSKADIYVDSTGSGKNGTVEISNKYAKPGDKVTVTVKPDRGYELDKLVIKDRNGNKIDVKENDNGEYTFIMPDSGKVDIDPIFTKIEETEEEREEETKREPIEMNTITNRTFNDVRANDWFKTAVDYVVSEGIMAGVGDRDFAPNQYMTRAMVWQVLAKIDGVNTAGGAKWYSKAMDWAMTHKISDGSNVNGQVTREQIASMLYRYAKDRGMNVSVKGSLAKFPDAQKVSGYASEAMQWAVGAGLVNGMDGKLNPQGNATRAQVATMLMNFHQLMK